MDRHKLPNATTSLILGILSLITCICYGVIGLPLGIIAVILGNKAIKEFNANPENYSSVGNASAGKIMGIIGIILNTSYILIIVWILYRIGWDALQDTTLLEQRVQDLLGK